MLVGPVEAVGGRGLCLLWLRLDLRSSAPNQLYLQGSSVALLAEKLRFHSDYSSNLFTPLPAPVRAVRAQGSSAEMLHS